MKPCLFIISILISALSALAQPKKVFVTEKGKPTDNSKDASFYYMVEKKYDTAYFASKYNLKDELLSTGFYKEEALKTPNGAVEYYMANQYRDQRNRIVTDGTRFVGTSGFFINGMRTGIWVDYLVKDLKLRTYTFKNNKLNGPYQEYDVETRQIIEKGNFINDKREGEIITYTRDGLNPYCTYTYVHNTVQKAIFHYKAPIAPKNFDKYLEKATDPFFDFLKTQAIVVKLAINESGKVDSVLSYNKPLDQNVIEVVNKAFLNAAKFTPGIANDIPNKQYLLYNFRFGSAGDDRMDPAQANRDHIFSNHANDIGRGLNTVGFGTPVYN